MNFPKLPRVEVEWQDAIGAGGWRTVENCKQYATSSIKSVGYLVVENKHQVTIVRTISNYGVNDDNVCGDVLTIPKGWVTKVTRI